MNDNKQWYELPIEVSSVESGRYLVSNGHNGGSSYPFRCYWPDVEMQREELAEMFANRPQKVTMMLPEDDWCDDCPDGEACATGWSCEAVRAAHVNDRLRAALSEPAPRLTRPAHDRLAEAGADLVEIDPAASSEPAEAMPKTQEEKVAFRKEWDARVAAAEDQRARSGQCAEPAEGGA